ncbi:MAG: hypothetical protein V1827_02410, partial [Candidatus Micrarchaeota archaeon]
AGVSPVQATCVIYAPYIQVTSGTSGSVFSVDRSDLGGDLADDEFYIAMSTTPVMTEGYLMAAQCDGNNNGVFDDDADGPNGPHSYFLGSSYYTASLPAADEDIALPPGTVFMKISPSSEDYGFSDFWDPAKDPYPLPIDNPPVAYNYPTIIGYEDIGDGETGFIPGEGGAIAIADYNLATFGDDGVLDLIYSAGAPGMYPPPYADLLLAISEKAGTGSSSDFVDYYVFGVDETGSGTPGDATFDFASGDPTFWITSDDEEVLYGHALANPADPLQGHYFEFYDTDGIDGCDADALSGPVDSCMEMVEEGYISERGSKFKLIDDNTVEFDMAHKLARAEWYLAPSSSSAADSSKTIVTLGEGESETVSGITIKVLEITEDVGSCSAGEGSVGCTADMTPVSAVIMPQNAPTLSVAVPYGSYGNLVILDTDAAGVNTIVSIGGDKVNSVTADLLASSPVDWTAEKKVVREVVAGSKIVVAGAEASDTLAAAQDFVTQVKKV